jgi:hypothetical protein
MLKIFFKKLKKYYFDIFINKNILKNNYYYTNHPYQNSISIIAKYVIMIYIILLYNTW